MEVKSGTTPLSANSKILFSDDQLDTVALLLAAELKGIHNLDLPVVSGTAASDGDILITIDGQLEGEQYKLTVDGKVTLEVAGLDGAYPGTVTILQAVSNSSIPNMVIEDESFRPFRSLMIDIKTHWYSMEHLKWRIRLARLYKISYFNLHTGETQWIGALTTQLSGISQSEREKNFLYTRKQMDELIAFGKLNGVYLYPHNETSASTNHMRDAMRNDYVPNDQYGGFADEIDGQGSFADFNQSWGNARWKTLIRKAHKLSYAQFAAGYPEGKKMPLYHMGPIDGEAGGHITTMEGGWCLDFLKQDIPDILIGYWPGGAIDDQYLTPHKDRIVPFGYVVIWSRPLKEYLQAGYKIVNSCCQPCYIVGNEGHWSECQPEDVFKDFHLYRESISGGNAGPDKMGYEYATWQDMSGVNDDKVLGSNFSTWENNSSFNWKALRPKLPAYSEHAWNDKEWPYPSGDWAEFQSRYTEVAKLVDDFVDVQAIGDVTTAIEQDNSAHVALLKSIRQKGNTITFPLSSNQAYKVQVFGINGKILKTQKSTANSITVDTQSLAMGVYTILFTVNSKTLKYRFTKLN